MDAEALKTAVKKAVESLGHEMDEGRGDNVEWAFQIKVPAFPIIVAKPTAKNCLVLQTDLTPDEHARALLRRLSRPHQVEFFGKMKISILNSVVDYRVEGNPDTGLRGVQLSKILVADEFSATEFADAFSRIKAAGFKVITLSELACNTPDATTRVEVPTMDDLEQSTTPSFSGWGTHMTAISEQALKRIHELAGSSKSTEQVVDELVAFWDDRH